MVFFLMDELSIFCCLRRGRSSTGCLDCRNGHWLTAARPDRCLGFGGGRGSRAVPPLLENPRGFLSFVQVGITSMVLPKGIWNGAAFSDALAVWPVSMGISERVFTIPATTIVVNAITFITIIWDALLFGHPGRPHPDRFRYWWHRQRPGLSSLQSPLCVC